MTTPVRLRQLMSDFKISRATVYRWANGEQLPSSKHLGVYELFLKESGRMKGEG